MEHPLHEYWNGIQRLSVPSVRHRVDPVNTGMAPSGVFDASLVELLGGLG